MIESTKAKFSRTLLLLISFALFCCLTACGGSKDGNTSTVPGSNTTTTGQASLVLTLSSNTVSFGTPVTAAATLRDASGNLVSGAVVTFAATSNLVTFAPASASAMTTGGVATISIDAASIDSAGATSITASTTFTSGGTTTTVTSSPVGISVGAVSLAIHSLTLGTSSISAYGTSTVAAQIYLGGSLATVPISVAFSSPCVSAGKATLATPVTTIAGTATSTYKDNGCSSGSDIITAVVTGDSQDVTINVATPATNNIQFTSATPAIIGTSTASAATLPTSSLVKFRVVDNNNAGISGIGVTFSMLPINYASLGVSFSPATATSDSSGYVTTSVSSGTVPTPVWVVAAVTSNPSLRSQSNTLVITTGLPAQNSFSLSAQSYNIEGWDYDGVTSALTIIASDRMGNPVPDGTAISFTSEGAQIVPGTCATASGTCSVNFRSADARPTDGRVTILAYALGEESFVDLNGNNVHDPGETYVDLGIPFVDNNFNGIWDSGEDFLAITSGSAACPGGFWSKTNTCDGVWGQNYVRRSTEIILSGSYAQIDDDGDTFPDATPTVGMASTCTQYFTLYLMDLHRNPMPAGTTVAPGESEVYYIPFGATAASAATITVPGGSPIFSSNALGGTPIVLKVKADCSAGTPVAYPSGTASIVVTTPKGNISLLGITVTP